MKNPMPIKTGAIQMDRGNVATTSTPAQRSDFVAVTSPQPTVKAFAAQKPFVSEQELLTIYPFCRRTLFDYRTKGMIPFVALGGRVIYHLASVEAALLRLQRHAE